MLLPQFAYSTDAEPTKLKIAASTTQIADFAKKIGGDDIVVFSVLGPGADPHTYQPTPGDMKKVSQSDICFENGLHLEGKDWMRTLCTDAKKPVITTTKGVQPLLIESEGHKISDPHAWFSPVNVAKYVNNITQALIEIRPSLKSNFSARAKLFLEELRVLDQWLKELFAQIPPDKRVLITSHDAFNYFCNTYKFNAKYNYLSVAPVGWSTGAEVGAGMTPARRQQVISSIKQFGVKAIFVETSVNPKLVRSIAKDAGVKIGGVLYSDSMGEAGSAGESYLGMMTENALTIVNALK
ncbi:MAG: zinc ABC transporter substrate-binding protein [Oligoflexia bacterium]|nr:zinc ABC transporter substrate-binding protein [Oligoflexia bacterium]